MELINPNVELLFWSVLAICVCAVWEIVWKAIALWKAARNNHLGWFVCIAVINSAGILPIIYILMQKKMKNIENQ